MTVPPATTNATSARSAAAAGHRAGLDLLRGIAAVFVMLHHAEVFYGVRGLWSHAYLAVDFFFLLSGFVLAIRYEDAMRARHSPKAFLALRVRRLWPTMAVGIVLGAVVSGLDGVPIAALAVQLLVQLCFMPVFAGRFPLFPLNGVQWSLLVELVANAVHALLFYRLSTRICAALLVPAAVILVLLVHRAHGLAVGDLGSNWYAGLVRVCFSYLCGIVLGRCWQASAADGLGLAGSRWQSVSTVSLAGVPLVLLLGASAIGGVRYFDAIVVILVFPPLLWLAAIATPPRGIAWLAVRLGSLSYPLYALHLPLIRAGELLGRGMSRLPLVGIRIGALIVAVGAAWLLARWTAQRGCRSAPMLQPEPAPIYCRVS